MLSREQRPVTFHFPRHSAASRPACCHPVRVTRLVHDGIERIAPFERQHCGQIMTKCRRERIIFQQFMQLHTPALCTQDNPHRTPTIRTDLVAIGRNNLPLPSQVINLAHPVPILGELAIIGFGFIHHDPPSFGVNIFNRMPHGRQSAGEDSSRQPFGVGAEIAHGSETPE